MIDFTNKFLAAFLAGLLRDFGDRLESPSSVPTVEVLRQIDGVDDTTAEKIRAVLSGKQSPFEAYGDGDLDDPDDPSYCSPTWAGS